MQLRILTVLFFLGWSATPVLAQSDPELGETAAKTKRHAKKKGKKKASAQPESGSQGEPASVDANAWSGSTNASADTSSASETSSAKTEWETPPGDDDEEEDGDEEEDEDDDEPAGHSDHESVVHSFSLGLLGLAELPIGVADPVNAPGGSRAVPDTLTAPVIGTRFWFTPRFGIEAGFGLNLRNGTIKRGDNENDGAKALAFAATLGVPISLVYGKHYNVLVIPNFGFGTSSATDTRHTAEDADDVFGKGTAFEAGLKGGVEAQLGAVGLPGLALQLTLGVRFRYETLSANVPVLDDTGTLDSSYDIESTNTAFTTSPGSSLGSAVAGAIAAIYYF
jgi:hypothetical protein